MALLLVSSYPMAVSASDESPKSSGTGFAVSRQGHILTNYHVVEDCPSIRVVIDGEPKEVTIVGFDKKNDLAILKLPRPLPNVARFREGRNIRSGDSVLAVGFPFHNLLASEANVTTGTVSAMAGLGNDTRFLQITAPVQPGNSGGPLLDKSGHIVGIVVSKLNALAMALITGDIPQNINFAIKAGVARSFLDSYDVHYEEAASGKQLEAAEVGETAKRFTYLLACYSQSTTAKHRAAIEAEQRALQKERLKLESERRALEGERQALSEARRVEQEARERALQVEREERARATEEEAKAKEAVERHVAEEQQYHQDKMLAEKEALRQALEAEARPPTAGAEPRVGRPTSEDRVERNDQEEARRKGREARAQALSELGARAKIIQEDAEKPDHYSAISSANATQANVAPTCVGVNVRVGAMVLLPDGTLRKVVALHEASPQCSDPMAPILADLAEARVTSTPVPPVTAAVTPSTAFNLAYNDYLNGKYRRAVEGFQRFVKDFPGSSLTPNAYYWIGESLYNQQSYSHAITTFEYLVEEYPGNEKVSAALYRLSLATAETGDLVKSRKYLKRVIEEFPASYEARLAKTRLAETR